MADSLTGGLRKATALAVVSSAVLLGGMIQSAIADVTSVKGSAFGVSAQNVTIFGGAQPAFGPRPTVTLPAAGSTPVTGHDDSETVQFGPATLFQSGAVDVSTQGALGASGSVTSSATINNVTIDNGGQLAATKLAATCTASQSGVTGSTTITNGVVSTNTDSNSNVTSTQNVPAAPAANTTINGTLMLSATDTETFTYVFNEQTQNSDGSLTVTAVHEILHGPTAKGDLFYGQVTCGVTATASTTTTTTAGGTTTTTAAGGTTTSTTATTTTLAGSTTTTSATTTTTAPATTTTSSGAAVTDVGGGAYGFFSNVSLFGGPSMPIGPTPTVTLPAGGSATPVTASAPTGKAQYGPATLFSSNELDVSTQGTTGANGSVTSSATINNENTSQTEVFTASLISSTCTATQSGVSASTTVNGGSVILADDPNSGNPTNTVNIATNPAPNTSFDGVINTVGDHFRIVFNEQQASAGSMTVNAMHLYLLGPTAVGDLFVGQSRCLLAATSGGGTGGTGTTGGGGGAGATVARTGANIAKTTALALDLVVAGWFAVRWAERRRLVRHLAVERRESI